MRTEREVRRFFVERGLTVHSIRRSKHWIVTAGKHNEEPGRYIVSVSASDHRSFKNLESEIKRGGHRFTL